MELELAEESMNNAVLDIDSTSQLANLSSYILSLLPLLLSASQVDLRRSLFSSGPAGSGPPYNSLLLRFANEPQLQSIYVNKLAHIHAVKSENHVDTVEHADNTELENEATPNQQRVHSDIKPALSPNSFNYTISTSLSWQANNVASLALIKRVATLDVTSSLSDQLHYVNLFGPALSSGIESSHNGLALVKEDLSAPSIEPPDSAARAAKNNPYESIHSIVHLAVQPYFDAYVSRKNIPVTSSTNPASASPGRAKTLASSPNSTTGNPKNNNIANTGIPIAKKKFAELELSLLHLQQNVEIPEIVLGVHPVVLRAIERVCQDRLHSINRKTEYFRVTVDRPAHRAYTARQTLLNPKLFSLTRVF